MIANEVDSARGDGAAVDATGVDRAGVADATDTDGAGAGVTGAGAQAGTRRHTAAIPTAAAAGRCLIATLRAGQHPMWDQGVEQPYFAG